MAASWFGTGTTTVVGGLNAITPTLPASIAAGDILLLFVTSANETTAGVSAGDIAAPAGWAIVTGTGSAANGQGAAAGATATRLTVFWLRYTGSEGNPTVADTGDHTCGVIHAFRGCIATGNPWDVVSAGSEATSDTSLSATGVTTGAANEIVAIGSASETDIGTARISGSAWTNANLTSPTQRSDGSVTSGSGGGIAVATGVKAAAGATGATTATYLTATLKSFVTIALLNPPPDASITTSAVTCTTSIPAPDVTLVQFDAVGPSSAGAGNTSTATLSWTHTTIAASTMIIAGCALDNTSDAGMTMTCKCDGVLMTSLGTVESDTQTAGFLQAWQIGSISAGAHTILVTASSAPSDLEGGSVSFAGAGSTGSPVTNSGTSATASAAVTSNTAGNMIAGFTAVGDNIVSSANTSRFINNNVGGAGHATGNAAGATAPATGSTVTMSWTLTAGSDPWAALAVELIAGGGGTDASITTTAVTCTTGFGAGTIRADQSLTTTVLAAAAAFGADTITTGGTDASITTTALNATIVFGTSTVAAGTGITTAVLAAATAFGTDTVRAGTGITTPAITATTSFGADTIRTGSGITSPAITCATAFGNPVLRADETATTAVFAAPATFGSPTVSAGGNAAITTPAVTAAVAFGTDAIRADQKFTTSGITLLTIIPAPTIAAGGNANVTTTAVTLTSLLAAPALTASSAITAATIQATALLAAPGLRADTRITLTGFTAVTTIPLPGGATIPATSVAAVTAGVTSSPTVTAAATSAAAVTAGVTSSPTVT